MYYIQQSEPLKAKCDKADVYEKEVWLVGMKIEVDMLRSPWTDKKVANDNEVEKRFHYLDIPTARFVEERDALREILRRIPPELRQKRFEGLADYVALEDPNAKRSSLKRLAILSARGFGRK
ncbi:hypothetical protein TELCIR_03169 [Teladorsagia circumcincta]|uniref:Uncharacterized protein n=1 Tax=Teladorsagia circumcincta TaxID=45464 RepID=A0A2G9UX66_TELCI|nr:hypothetical protein TELCIR_03169 [Teladorsagia circumcincta]